MNLTLNSASHATSFISYLVAVRYRLINTRDPLGAHQVVQILRQALEIVVFLLLPLVFLALRTVINLVPMCQENPYLLPYLSKFLSILLQILTNQLSLLCNHAGVLFPTCLIMFILSAIVPSEAPLQLYAQISKE